MAVRTIASFGLKLPGNQNCGNTICGQAGHSAKECSKSTSRASKDRAATATLAAPSLTSTSSEAKE